MDFPLKLGSRLGNRYVAAIGLILLLVAIPTFIFMGVMMERSGITQDLFY